MRTHERIVLAHHLVLTLYGHWPPNDLRGSGSTEFYDEKFAELGPIHQGRKPQHLQPSRKELRAFHRQAGELMNFPVFWIPRNDAKRQVMAIAFREAVRRNRYTCYACAICSNHAHFVIRRHRDSFEEMFENLTSISRHALIEAFSDELSAHHPVFSQRPYGVFLYTVEDIRGRIEYVEQNPVKEGLARQRFDFMAAYDGWPFAKKRGR